MMLTQNKSILMVTPLDGFYLNKEEPVRGFLLSLRRYILKYHPDMTETWTHRMPMFRLRGKLFAYLWTDKKTHLPYIGIYRGIDIEHPKLDLGNRNKMKIMTMNPEVDLPIGDLNSILDMAIALYD